jgi:ribosomal protein L37E/uncharacterized protein YkuJ
MLSIGAINKITKEYTHPIYANKNGQYICPECKKDLILCQGEIRVHHFRHKSEIEPCNYFISPTETVLHKDAKELISITIKRKCRECSKANIEIEIDHFENTIQAELEYRFEYNGTKIADVACLNNGEIKYIFEICNTHKTKEENRPEPWFEIDALDFIKSTGKMTTNKLTINCMRSGSSEYRWDEKYVCANCLNKFEIETGKIRDYLNKKFTEGEVCPSYFETDEENNQKIIDLFNDQLENNRVIICNKDCMEVYIIDKYDYDIYIDKRPSLNREDIINWKYHIVYNDPDIGQRCSIVLIYELINFCKNEKSLLSFWDEFNKNNYWIDPSNNVYLLMAFNDKDKIKNLGAKWSPAKNLWYISYKIYSEHTDFIKSLCIVFSNVSGKTYHIAFNPPNAKCKYYAVDSDMITLKLFKFF